MEEKGVVVLMSSRVGVTGMLSRVPLVVFPISSVALVREFPGSSIKTNNKGHDLTPLKVVCHGSRSNLFPFVFRQSSLTFINLRC